MDFMNEGSNIFRFICDKANFFRVRQTQKILYAYSYSLHLPGFSSKEYLKNRSRDHSHRGLSFLKVPGMFLLIATIFFVDICFCDDMIKGDIKILVREVKNEDGYLLLALCSNEEQYYTEENIFRIARVVPVEGVTKIKIKEVPYGTYAVKVFHDENANNKLDKGLFGVPKESYGFSNNPRIRRGKPSFEETSFEFGPGYEEIEILLR